MTLAAPVGRDPATHDGTTPPPALELQAVTRHRGSRRILGPLDLTVHAGETVAILGPNGAGKSTLLNLASGILEGSGGLCRVLGLDPHKEGEATRRAISILTQQAPLYDELSPHEHLTWWAGLRKVAVDAEALLADARLSRVAHRPCSQLSRGERQKTALAMAFVGDPQVLLLDEPFTALDDAGRGWLQEAIAARRGRFATIIALHDQVQAGRIADRVLRLDDGHWAFHGTASPAVRPGATDPSPPGAANARPPGTPQAHPSRATDAQAHAPATAARGGSVP